MLHVEVTTRGHVSQRARGHAQKEVAALERYVKGPVLAARVVLVQEANPRIATPARAEAELDLQGRFIRARSAAPSMGAAVDEVAERLKRQLRRHVDRLVDSHREPTVPSVGEWSHRSWSPPHRPNFERPIDEREIIRRKSFAFGPMPVEQAADTLEDLDHEFFLFHDAESDADVVLYWRDDGLLAMIVPSWVESSSGYGPLRVRSRYSSRLELQAAVAEMNATGHRFLFFENAATGRGNVIYSRYDGHYGLIEPV